MVAMVTAVVFIHDCRTVDGTCILWREVKRVGVSSGMFLRMNSRGHYAGKTVFKMFKMYVSSFLYRCQNCFWAVR